MRLNTYKEEKHRNYLEKRNEKQFYISECYHRSICVLKERFEMNNDNSGMTTKVL